MLVTLIQYGFNYTKLHSGAKWRLIYLQYINSSVINLFLSHK